MSLTSDEAAALVELEFELGAPHTLETIAEYTGMALRSVHRIEKRALKKLLGLLEDQGASWSGGLRDPSVSLHRRCDDAYPSDGMTRPARRSGQ